MKTLTAQNSSARENGLSSTARGVKLPSVTRFDPDEIRRIVEVGKQRGLIQGGDGQAVKLDKNGMPAGLFGRMEVKWIEVSPEIAGQWLRNNFRNRPVVQDVVKAYARDMINGVWVPTHQGIAFNDKEELIDGQHRLMAVVACGKTVRMMVTFGLPSRIDGKEMTTMDAVDRGRTRSVADQLTIQHGMKNGSMTASICAALASLCYGERTRRLSVGQTLEVYRAFEAAAFYVIANRSREYGLRSTGVLAGFAFAMMPECDAGLDRLKGVAPEKPKFYEGEIARLFHSVNDVTPGGGPKAGSTAKLLQAFLTSDEAKLFTRSLDRGLAELVLQAIWLDKCGKKIEKLEPGLEGAKYFAELQMERVEKIRAIFKLPS